MTSEVTADADSSNETSSTGENEEVPAKTGGEAPLVVNKSIMDDDDDIERTDGAKSGFSLSSPTWNPNKQQEQKLVRRETQAVKLSKVFVVLAIVGSAIACSTVTRKMIQRDEMQEFKSDFDRYATEIEEVSEFTATRAFGAIRSLSKSITASALTAGNSSTSETVFPFFSMPYFHVQGGETRDISGAEVVLFAPLVKTSQKEQWEDYARTHQDWVQEGLSYRGVVDVNPGNIPEEIYSFKERRHEHKPGEVHVPDYYLPIWQMAGAPKNASIVNLDLLTRSSFEHTMVDVLQNSHGILSDICSFTYLTEHSQEEHPQQDSAVDKDTAGNEAPHPQSYILEPVYEAFDEDAEVAGFVVGVFPWNGYFRNVLPENVDVSLVVNDRCGDIHTYEINGPSVRYVGEGDLSHKDCHAMKYSVEFATFARHQAGPHPRQYHNFSGMEYLSYEEAFGGTYDELFQDTSRGHCAYEIAIYPTPTLLNSYITGRARIYSWAVVGVFGLILILILIFDVMVMRRQRKLMDSAIRTNAIVSSLFPKNVQNRILAGAGLTSNDEAKTNSNSQIKQRPHSIAKGGSRRASELLAFDTKPIADLFPFATVMFMDLSGFTAWSSAREPSSVFALLEKIYHTFDTLAAKRGVFKVETVGDCYVAAAGLPEIRPDHAPVMARFARACLARFPCLVREMEVVFGPDTCDIGLRTGLHSGPVTAGVLRGQKSRFQLFGDTVNTAARMESTGMKNRIQISQTTADELIAHGMDDWIRKREALVMAKGKGEMQTYWLEADRNLAAQREISQRDLQVSDELSVLDAKQSRLIEWNFDILSRLLKQVVVARGSSHAHNWKDGLPTWQMRSHLLPLDEVKEIITLPTKKVQHVQNIDNVELPTKVSNQLYDYVTRVARMYRDNPFHSFEHASHVTMSVMKLMKRIVQSDTIDYDDMCYKDKESIGELRDHAYGITSDPLTQFACAFSALIHDIDHQGVSNHQLVKENSELAQHYRNKSMAEQNSVELAWYALLEPEFACLRGCIYKTNDERERFRQLVVNSVMATDIVDKELGLARKKRWEKAFANKDGGLNTNESFDHRSKNRDDVNRKATIVIEHLIQASDVAHTMQHWHVYLKWNERLFHETYQAYLDGKGGDKDPSKGWYEGELGFFDYYIIPLAKKLKECGVFGVSSDEYLNYALANRSEWEQKGREVIDSYMATHKSSIPFDDEEASA